MKKRILAAVLASASILGAVAGCSSNATSSAGSSTTDSSKTENSSKTEDSSKTDDSSNAGTSDKFTLKEGEGKTLNIAVWNEEFKNYFDKYIKAKMPEGVTVNFKITENKDNAYQNKLDEDLPKNEAASADDKIDMFLFEADYALKYVNSEYTLDVKSLGLTDEDLSGMYQYTKDVCTTQDDAKLLKGVSWQATPGLYAYRRSIAKDVLGTDDPAKVQEALADWTKFDEVAAKAADKGYKMLSGYDDAYRTFSNNVAAPWVNENKEIIVDANIMKWVDDSKELVDAGETGTADLWSDDWKKGFYPEGKVFCYFGPAWLVNFSMAADTEGSIGYNGGWGAAQGPQGFFWGGTWICAAQGTDNANLVKDIMLKMTTDDDIMKDIVVDDDDFVNNSTVMNGMADGSIKVKDNKEYSSKILGGQNPLPMYCAGVETLDLSNLSSYDQGCNEEFQNAMKNYFEGNATYDEALDLFYKAVVEKYPELSNT